MITNWPEELVPGKYNIVATNGDNAAILWKDGKYYVIGGLKPDFAMPISELRALSIDYKGHYVHPKPIPLNELSEWKKRAAEVKIPLPWPKSDKDEPDAPR